MRKTNRDYTRIPVSNRSNLFLFQIISGFILSTMYDLQICRISRVYIWFLKRTRYENKQNDQIDI